MQTLNVISQRLNAVVNKVKSATDIAASGSQTMDSSAEEMAATAEELVSQAEQLQHTMAFFRIDKTAITTMDERSPGLKSVLTEFVPGGDVYKVGKKGLEKIDMTKKADDRPADYVIGISTDGNG